MGRYSMLHNFSYLIDGKVAGSGHPGAGAELRESLQWLASHGFRGVLSLTEDGLPKSVLEEHGLKFKHIPIQDFCPPRPEQIEQALRFIDSAAKEGAVLAHCAAGHGRTGTILACHLVGNGMSAAEAIEEVRRKRPGSIETLEQEESVREYAKSLQE
jgi:atypical dual specificity phosphatase